MNKKLLTIGAALCTFGIASLAFAEPAEACEGKRGKKFERADANGDGYLTEEEVGAERWERLVVADANSDGFVSREEIKQAKEDGLLKRKGKGKEKREA